jgi:hypothetical protein
MCKIITAWETIKGNINISAKESLRYEELKKYNPRFDEGCSKLLDQRKEENIAAATGDKRNKWE